MKKPYLSVRFEDEPGPGSLFPVVAIAASGPGVESVRRLLPRFPVDSGMAFVITPTPSAQSAGALVSLLAGATLTPIREVASWTGVKPNNVYVVPSDRPVRIVHLVLMFAPRPDGGTSPNPTDYFFRSLAADRGTLAIGLMLSPVDAADIAGLQAIRKNGGIAIVQNDGPHRTSPVSPWIADLVLSREEIADALQRIGRTADPSRAVGPPGARDLPDRMKLSRCESLDSYLEYLQSSSSERARVRQ